MGLVLRSEPGEESVENRLDPSTGIESRLGEAARLSDAASQSELGLRCETPP
jgi:hypothetical protein